MKKSWLKEIRDKKGMTQQETAEKCGLNRGYYSMIELGIRVPNPQIAKRIGATLGFDWTLFYEPDPAEEIAQEA